MKAHLSLGMLSMLVLSLLLLLTNDWRLWRQNIDTVRTVQAIFPQATSHLAELYGTRSDISPNEDAQIGEDVFKTEHSLSLALIIAALNNDYVRISNLAANSLDECRDSPACRLLAGKAFLRLGQDHLTFEAWSGDAALWSRLVGQTAMTPQTQADLQFLERYYGILRDISPEQAAPYFMLGAVYRSRGGWQRAVPFFAHAVAIEPDNARYLCTLGQSLVVTQQDIGRGLTLCNTARQRAPLDMWIQEQAARTFASAEECDTAAEIYQQMANRFSQRSEPAAWLKSFQEGKIGGCGVNGTE